MSKIQKIIKFPRKIVISLIKFYQLCISPRIGSHCKYYPTCSEYTKQAVDKYGIIKGSLLGIIRILKCNPFSKGGVDLLK
ncbi:MAG: membrane protein insertion efficiency factor YidD [Clostridia bacterium]|nr:membrane protein insertion efficiency factor YidD [Clostridia bacterium]